MEPTTQPPPADKGKRARLRAVPADDAVVKIDEIKKSIDALEQQYQLAREAAADYKDLIDAVSAKAGVGKKPLRAFVKARVDDKVKEAHAGAEQLSLLFENIG